ncbi:parB-like partition protein [Chloroherpeton thalassium ATCC 35110]|uniref:ParB-like partition protein n=1 Tax=Chloroherpeton thalassium (strain ATCC 35110 / GB-78) TaxID=517418 RepID=B3QYM6_CHLT3|nr:ParB/RepB/Spo0J family partition protein [Chloroherpeton thalassium]ACF15099.1 parB-like partition protein [Chloroherpeton thalassium ATCC 35110]
MAKVALGKGLRALISDESIHIINKRQDENGEHIKYRDTKSGRLGSIGNVPLHKIEPNPYQPREEFDRSALEELKQSIIEKGIIQPITIRVHGEKYQLISGERRLRAAKEAGFTEIPAYVLDIKTDEEMLELALIENIQREKLNPIEVATGFQRLIQECSLTQEQVSQRVGKDRSTVTNFLRLLKLPEEIQTSLRKNEISMGHARALITLESLEAQLEIWQLILKHNLSVRKVEALVSRFGKEKAADETETAEEERARQRNVDELNLESLLREKFATKVKLQHNKKGHGQIVIEYYSLDDLDRIVETINSIG